MLIKLHGYVYFTDTKLDHKHRFLRRVLNFHGSAFVFRYRSWSFCCSRSSKMTSFIKLVSLIIVLSIAGDFLSLGRHFLYSPGDGTGVQSTLLFPGADAILGPLARAAAKAISKSALKAAKKRKRTKQGWQAGRRTKPSRPTAKVCVLPVNHL